MKREREREMNGVSVMDRERKRKGVSVMDGWIDRERESDK